MTAQGFVGGDPTKQQALTVTATKTANYAAVAGQLVLANATAGSFTTTLPAANVPGQVVGAKLIATASGNTVPVVPSGTDRINASGTSVTLQLADEVFLFTSDGTGHWWLSGGQKSLPSLDGRYAQLSGSTFTGAVGIGAAPLEALDVAGDTSTARRMRTSSAFETDSSGTAETIRLHATNPAGKTGNSAKNAIAWIQDDLSATTAQVWVQVHDYLHWYNAITIASTAVNTASDQITATSHGLPTTPGWRGQWTTTGTLPAPLALATNYYAKRIDNNTLEIYTDSGLTSKVDFTTQGTGSHTFTPDNTFFNNRHRHFSIEVSNSDFATKNTRLSIPWGFDVTEIGTFQANVNINDGVLRVNGAAGGNRELQLNGSLSDNLAPDLTNLRWSVRADSTAESGSNVGSDFRLVRFSDTGGAIDSPLFIKRSTGLIGFSGVTNPGANIDVGLGTGTVTVRANRGANSSTSVSFVLNTAGTDEWSIQMRNDSTNDLHIRNSAQGLTALLIENRATAPNISLLTLTKSYGGGVGVVFVANASTVPTTNPTGGGILYCDTGALKYRGTSGTVTTIGAA